MAKGKYYPVFIDLAGRRCLVVGGGNVAARKVISLLEAGARVVVVSPAAGEEIRKLAAEGAVEWLRREFAEYDLEGSFLVIGATDDPQTNRRVFHEAERRAMLANIVDEPEVCNFIVPSLLSRGDFQVAISTGGASPILARKLRRELEKRFGPAYGEIVEELAHLRAALKDKLASESARRRFWEKLVDIDFLDSLSEGEAKLKIRERAERCLSQLED